MTAKPRITDHDRELLLQRLSDPFPASKVKWLVIAKNPAGTKGKLFAYADPRAYTDRLNEAAGPDGWSDSYTVATLDGLSREDGERTVQTGKVFVVCTLTIKGLGTRSGTGERWGDDPNAMTEADAQALKRACSRFGLGRYLYDLGPFVVPLGHDGRPTLIPELPQWAWPSDQRTGPVSQQAPIESRGPVYMDAKVNGKIESFRSLIGDAIYLEILRHAGQCESARAILTRQRQIEVLRRMQGAAGLIHRIRSLTRRLGHYQLITEMEELHLSSAVAIPSLEQLMSLVDNLERIAVRKAA